MAVSLKNCPEGLFTFGEGHLGFKSEYKTESMSRPGVWQSDAYVVASGEYFWGGTPNPIDREKLLVEPFDIDEHMARVKADAVECLLSDPPRPCEAMGGCMDRSTCNDCQEPGPAWLAAKAVDEVLGPIMARPERMDAALAGRKELVDKIVDAVFGAIRRTQTVNDT